MSQLHAHYNEQCVTDNVPDDQVTINVYTRIADELCAEEEVESIVPRGYDHNVCAVCERYITALHDLRSKILCAERAALTGSSAPPPPAHPAPPRRRK